MLLVIFLTGTILWNLPWSNYENGFLVSAVEPGYLDFDNLPDTNFSCEGKVIGGYYADVETGCQMFHVCTIGQKSEITDIKFLCLNGTVFDQETRVCERLDEVDCSKSESFFDLNLELYGNNGGGYGIQPEDEIKEEDGDGGDGGGQVNCDEEYEEGDTACKKSSNEEKTKLTSTNIKEDTEYDWEEEVTTSLPIISSTSPSTTTSTTTAKPVTTSYRPTLTHARPTHFHYHPAEIPSISTTTPNTVAQLLALHEAFQENLKRREPAPQPKYRPSTQSPPPVPPPQKNPPLNTKIPLPFSHYKLSSAPQTTNHFTIPTGQTNKLPNSLSNLSQNIHFTSLASNRNSSPTVYKPVAESSPSTYYTHEGPSLKFGPAPNKTATNFQPPSVAPSKQPSSSSEYAYKIFNKDHGGDSSSRFRITASVAGKPSPASDIFKMEPATSQLAHSTFSITQNRPVYVYRTTKTSLKNEEEEDGDEDFEEAGNEEEEPSKSSQTKVESFSHSNFARAIPANRGAKNASASATDSVSVVLSTSSVSSSVSSKPKSAITSDAASGPHKSTNSFADNRTSTYSPSSLKSTTTLTLPYSNITDINEAFTEESYYEETKTDYDDNSQEYKDLVYQTDVQKIKQR